MACLDGAVLVTTDEHACVIGRAAGFWRIIGAVERRYCRNGDLPHHRALTRLSQLDLGFGNFATWGCR
jgi:hypothetical protein